MKLLSVIIPTLNEQNYLPLLLSALANQTNKNFEVIICDCKSDDKTVEKANEFKDRLNLKVHETERKNVAHQRNEGAKKATGDVVVFADADYLLKEDFVESCYREFDKSNADLLIPFSYPITNNPLWKIYFYLQNYLCVLVAMLGKNFGVASGNLIKKEAFLKMGGYNETVYVFEDQYYYQVAKKHKLKISLTNKIKMHFSLRRIKEDGIWGYFYFNIYATLHLIFKGPIYRKFYDYEMGGDVKSDVKN